MGSFFFFYKFCTHFKEEYKENSHLAKGLILRLPETKSEKEKNTYIYSEKLTRDVLSTNRSSRT